MNTIALAVAACLGLGFAADVACRQASVAGSTSAAVLTPDGGVVSHADVLRIARARGIETIEHIVLDGQTWQVGGSDGRGRVVDLDIALRGGAVLRVDRDAEFDGGR